MKNLFLSWGFFLSFIGVSLASGSYVGNGGDTLFCRPSADNPFKGAYTLDYLIEFRETKVGPIEIESFSQTVERLGSFFGANYPELATHFYGFMSAVRAERAMYGRHWMEESNGLIDIKDEEIQKLLPKNCLREKNGEEFLELHQTVIREAAADPIRYHYDRKILENLETNNPLQYSFFIVHEWLWDLTRDVRTVRKLNWLFHSEGLKRLTREDLSQMFDRQDVFKVKPSFCERSTQIKNVLPKRCEVVELKDLVGVEAISINQKMENPFRIGDFYGFGRVRVLNMSALNLKTYDLLPRIFFPLYTLKTLILSHNQLEGVSDEVSVDLKDLRELDMSYNPIKKVPFSFKKLRALETLSLSLHQELSSLENLPPQLKNLILILESPSPQNEVVLQAIKKEWPKLHVTVKNDF